MKCSCNKHIKKIHMQQWRTLSRGTAEDLRLTNQKKGAFNSHPRVENEYSICLFIFLPLDKNRILVFRFLKKKMKKKKKELFSNFSTFNI